MQITQGIYQIGGSLNGLTWTGSYASYEDGNTYIVRTNNGVIMFDSGCGDTMGQVVDNLKQWGYSVKDILACLITHAHMDHSGGAHLLKGEGIPLYAHPETKDAISTGDARCAGYLYHKQFSPCKVDHTVTEGTVLSIDGLDISPMHLPGHTMGCTAYAFTMHNQVFVVSGDVIGTLLDGHFGWGGSVDFNKEAYLDSLKRFARFDSDVMLPGHGMCYYTKPRWRVEQALEQALSLWR